MTHVDNRISFNAPYDPSRKRSSVVRQPGLSRNPDRRGKTVGRVVGHEQPVIA